MIALPCRGIACHAFLYRLPTINFWDEGKGLLLPFTDPARESITTADAFFHGGLSEAACGLVKSYEMRI